VFGVGIFFLVVFLKLKSKKNRGGKISKRFIKKVEKEAKATTIAAAKKAASAKREKMFLQILTDHYFENPQPPIDTVDKV
jgi:hypothetical protein